MEREMMMDIFEEVKNAETIAIGGHVKPDGDCIGSVLGIYLYLKKRCPEKTIIPYLQAPTLAFRNCPAIEAINSSFEWKEAKEPDVFILMDTIPSRLGDALPIFEKAKKTINIDHHISNAKGSGMVNYIDPDACAAALLAAKVIDWEYMDADIAALLYMGIAHDTGIFHFSNTTPETMRIVADLLEYDFDFSKLLDETFFEKSYKQNKLMSYMVLNSQLYFDGKVILSAIEAKDMESLDITVNDFSGVVNQLLITEGVESAILIYEKEPGVYKISLRAASDLVDVAKVSMTFGGGGHVRAAGVDISGSLQEIKEQLIAEVGKQLA